MSRRLKEEQPMYNSLHLKLDDTEKKTIVTETDIYRKEISQLQESLQLSYIRIKKLNEIINRQRDKIFHLEGAVQLEFKF